MKSIVLLPLLLCAKLWTESLAQPPPSCAQREDSTKMYWQQADDSLALCNDFTRAGFFLRRNESSDKWVIFLESGSLCYSNDTCNRRFFRQDFRDRESSMNFDRAAFPFGDFNPSRLSSSLRNTSFANFVNPRMTSMQCLNFSGEDIGVGRRDISVEGRDLLDPDASKNEFSTYNHVLIPYCSSDLWLADEVREEDENRNCSCGNLRCFNYSPEASRLQFAFRGRRIFRSIFKQLLASDCGMSDAREIILGGSSAGGVGVYNHAQWVREVMPDEATLLVLLDSSWFIDFQGGIFRVFSGVAPGEGNMSASSDNSQRLLSIISDHPSCTDTEMGFPCCVSAHCVLTTRNKTTGDLAYYPNSGTHTFVLNSVYDSFLLAPALTGLDNFGGVASGAEQAENLTTLLIDFLRVVGEYGGTMNFTFAQTFRSNPNVSYYTTQCLQHIYLATSTLWGEEGIFGTDAINLGEELVSFSHSIESGRWDLKLAATALGTSVSIRTAFHSWYTQRLAAPSEGVRFLDTCQGPYCNEICPDRLSIGQSTSNNWPLWAKIVIASSIVAIGMFCLFMKMLFALWLYRLERRLDDYLLSLDENPACSEQELEFPDCPDADKVAVSCLDLTYTVTVKKKKEKDETKDQTKAVVLHELTEESHEEEDPDNFRYSRRYSRRYTTSTRPNRKTLSKIGTLIKRKSSKHFDIEMNLDPPPPPPAPPPPPILPPVEPADNMYEVEYNVCGCGRNKRKILKGISIYFNPGEMIGIMGPSGSGKTTLLDMLTGRRKVGNIEGDIYVNGIPMNEIRDWYIANTGYVLQLAKPYYEELTVRDNLMLSAAIKLPETRSFTWKDKFRRVEQVMEITGLIELADTVVGGDTGPGLSGGQKRRLSIALQLLKLPSVLFLDEPTSGLDATSSMELLHHLNKLAETKRTVVLTIHQPRFEIFHMFHKLVLISDGKVAYHGAPEKAYEVFVSALRDRYLENGLIIPSLGEHNPADVIMDMLGNPSFRRILTEYYQQSTEPKLVKYAIKVARWREYGQSRSSLDSIGSAVSLAVFGAKRVGQRHAHTYTRMAALEARAAKRILPNQLAFLPVMFFLYALVLGTVYFQSSQGFLVVSGMCVFSVASGLFVFPTIEIYYTPALRVYNYERADGVGRAQDLVVQGFIRYITVAFVPVIVSTTTIYLLLINIAAYDILVYLQVVVVNIALNLTWTALLIALMLALPTVAFRISSLIASVFGLTSGFFIPIDDINWVYRWIAYINPNYYGFSSVAFFLLEDYNPECEGSEFTCVFSSGAVTLRQFSFQNVNPYFHLLILIGFIFFFLLLSVFIQWLRYTSVAHKIRRFVGIIIKKPSDELSREISKDRAGYERSISTATSLDNESLDDLNLEEYENFEAPYTDDDEVYSPSENVTTPLYPIAENDEEEEEEAERAELETSVSPLTPSEETPSKKPHVQNLWKSAAQKCTEENGTAAHEAPPPSNPEDSVTSTGSGWKKVRMVRINDEGQVRDRPQNLGLGAGKKLTRRKSFKTPFLSEGASHMVWRPKKRPELANLVERLQSQYNTQATGGEEGSHLSPRRSVLAASPAGGKLSPRFPGTGSQLSPRTPSLRSRQKTLFNRVIATQAVLKESTDELLSKDDDPDEEVEPVATATKKPTKPRVHMTLLDASKKVTENLKKQKSLEEKKPLNFSDIVSQFIANSKASGDGGGAETSQASAGNAAAPRGANRHSTSGSRSGDQRRLLQRKETRGAIPIHALREIVREEKLKNDPSKRHSMGAVGAGSEDRAPPTSAPPNTTDFGRTPLSKMANLKKTKTTLTKQPVFDTPLEEQEEQEELEERATPISGPTDDPAITLTSYTPLSNSNNNNNNNSGNVAIGRKRKGTQRLGFYHQAEPQSTAIPRGRVQKLALSRQQQDENVRKEHSSSGSSRRSGVTSVTIESQRATSGSDLSRPSTSDFSQRNSKSASEIFVQRSIISSSSSASSERGAAFTPHHHTSPPGGGATTKPRFSRSSRVEERGWTDRDLRQEVSIVSLDKGEHSESTI